MSFFYTYLSCRVYFIFILFFFILFYFISIGPKAQAQFRPKAYLFLVLGLLLFWAHFEPISKPKFRPCIVAQQEKTPLARSSMHGVPSRATTDPRPSVFLSRHARTPQTPLAWSSAPARNRTCTSLLPNSLATPLLCLRSPSQ